MTERTVLTEEVIRKILPERKRSSHKGENGYAVLFAGSEKYTGAALMSAAAAVRAGCGVLTAAVPGAVKPAFSALPEVCCVPVSDGKGWDEKAQHEAAGMIRGKCAVGMGCGMGEMEVTLLLEAVLNSRLPMVLDADGLNLLSRHPEHMALLHCGVILTPHPGELSRLTGKSVADLISDPERTATEYAAEWNCTLLLKGAESCISDGNRTVWNCTGNAGLAKGGSGDVLTGLILGLLAQGTGPFDAACAGSYLLGVSAERAYSLLGVRMLNATDVIDAVAGTIGAVCRTDG